MALLIASRFVMTDQSVAYPTAARSRRPASGVGFGLTVPAVNTFTAAFHPDAVDRSVLVLNALLGLGTALAPVFVAIFVGPRRLGGPAGAGRRPAAWHCSP